MQQNRGVAWASAIHDQALKDFENGTLSFLGLQLAASILRIEQAKAGNAAAAVCQKKRPHVAWRFRRAQS
jgi:hypothetical protein